ncbi:MAG: NHL repeat-containing protein [Lentisphaerae bacterium]|nr:NHL repeat-containing protein [Lentisphaerota bacterium]
MSAKNMWYGAHALALVLALTHAPPARAEMAQDHWYLADHWSSKGSTEGKMTTPQGLALGTNGWLYIADDLNRVHVWDTKTGLFVARWGSAGSANGQFNHPVDCAIDADGNVYVLEQRGHRVQVFSPTGQYLRKWGASGSADGQFGVAWSLDIGPDNLVYVADGSNHRIQVFDTQGNFIRKWGEEGTLPGQFDIILLYVDAAPDGLVYVNASLRNQVFRPDGTFVREFSIQDALSPSGSIPIGDDGLIFKCASDIVVCDLFGNALTTITAGKGLLEPDSFDPSPVPTIRTSPVDVAQGPDGTLYASSVEYQILVYRRGYRTMDTNAVPRPAILRAEQRSGTGLVDLDFMVHDGDSPTAHAAVLGLVDGADDLAHILPLSSLAEGTASNVNALVPTGTPLHLTWNAAADWDAEIGQIAFRVLANDGRNLLGFHFLTIPANGSNALLTISQSPVTAKDLLDCWHWLVATGDPEISLASGVVYGVKAPYANAALASGRQTTESGLAFLFDRLHVRAATPAEVAQAREGSTPGVVHQWAPINQIGNLPQSVNTYAFDTADLRPAPDLDDYAWWVVPLP